MMDEAQAGTYPDDVHPIRVPRGHRVAAQWEHPGGLIHEFWFSEESAAKTTTSPSASLERLRKLEVAAEAIPTVYREQMKNTGWSHYEMATDWRPLLLAWFRLTGSNPWDFFGADEGIIAQEYEAALSALDAEGKG